MSTTIDAIVRLLWLIFVVFLAIQWHRTGLKGVLSKGSAVVLTLLFSTSMLTPLVFRYVPRETGKVITGSEGLSLVQAASGGLIQFSSSAGAVQVDSNARPPAVVAAQQPEQVIVTWPESFSPSNVYVPGDLTLLKPDGSMQVVAGNTLPNRTGTACGWDNSAPLDARGYPSLLYACPRGASIKFALVEVQLSAGFPGVAEHLPKPAPTDVPTLSPAEAEAQQGRLNTQIAACWLKFADTNDLSHVTESLGARILPQDTTWTLTGPSDWAGFWQSAGSGGWFGEETWYLSNKDLAIEKYPITGVLARSFSNATRNGTVIVYGTGAVCTAQ